MRRPYPFGCVLRMGSIGRENTVKQSLTVAPTTDVLPKQPTPVRIAGVVGCVSCTISSKG